MTHWGWHASHEQISPQQLLRDAQHAEQVGFELGMCSEHFAPWSERQGHSGNAFVWLGAALATTDLTFGCVSAPGQRHHPAVHARHRDAGGDVPRPLLDRPRQRRGGERAHHRRAMAAQGDSRATPR